jgi:putative membrane protein
MRSLRDWGILLTKGFAMGAADIVPGVSGGTIAFISGIYDELLSTIAGLKLKMIRELFSEGLKSVWGRYNLSFLAVLAIGVVLGFLSLASVLEYLLRNYPVELRGFFSGLVIASVPIIARSVKKWGDSRIIALTLGFVLAFLITSVPPLVQSASPLFLFMCGAIAISAMILPGISGSFVMIILGAYSTMITALDSWDLIKIFSFMGGAVSGIILFSKALNKLIKSHKDLTFAVLTGFLLGAVKMIWPWKENVRILFLHSDCKEEWLMRNLIPSVGTSEILIVFGCVLLGAGFVVSLDRISKSQ